MKFNFQKINNSILTTTNNSSNSTLDKSHQYTSKRRYCERLTSFASKNNSSSKSSKAKTQFPNNNNNEFNFEQLKNKLNKLKSYYYCRYDLEILKHNVAKLNLKSIFYSSDSKHNTLTNNNNNNNRNKNKKDNIILNDFSTTKAKFINENVENISDYSIEINNNAILQLEQSENSQNLKDNEDINQFNTTRRFSKKLKKFTHLLEDLNKDIQTKLENNNSNSIILDTEFENKYQNCLNFIETVLKYNDKMIKNDQKVSNSNSNNNLLTLKNLKNKTDDDNLIFSISLEHEDKNHNGHSVTNSNHNNHQQINGQIHRQHSKPLATRCLSEPPNYKPFEFETSANINIIKNVNQSPTLKLLFNKLIELNDSSNKFLQSTDTQLVKENALNKLHLDDLVGLFSLNKLNLKRSFSHTKIKFDKKYIKKSNSFEKFLKNIVKGKRKSISLCNQTNQVSNISINSVKCNMKRSINNINKNNKSMATSSDDDASFKDAASSESDNLDEMFMMIMNNVDIKNLPSLKIEDSIKGSTQSILFNKRSSKTKLNDQQNNSNRNSINIPDSESIRKEANNLESQIDALIDNIKLYDKNSNNSYESISNLESNSPTIRNIQIKKSQSATVTQKVEISKINNDDKVTENNKNESNTVKLRNDNIRYATMSNFTLPNNNFTNTNEQESNKQMKLSPSWNFHTPPNIESILNTSTSNVSSSNNDNSNINEVSITEALSSAKSDNARTFQKSKSTFINSKIIPVKFTISQFKPILNLHKRTHSPVPCSSITSQLNTSTSIDSFLLKTINEPPNNNNDNNNKIVTIDNKNSISSTHHKNYLNESQNDNNLIDNKINESTVDLTKLTNPGYNFKDKKKISVTRSFSYNVGTKLNVNTDNNMANKSENQYSPNGGGSTVSGGSVKITNNKQSPRPKINSIDLLKTKASLTSINDLTRPHLGLSKSTNENLASSDMATWSQSSFLKDPKSASSTTNPNTLSLHHSNSSSLITSNSSDIITGSASATAIVNPEASRNLLSIVTNLQQASLQNNNSQSSNDLQTMSNNSSAIDVGNVKNLEDFYHVSFISKCFFF